MVFGKYIFLALITISSSSGFAIVPGIDMPTDDLIMIKNAFVKRKAIPFDIQLIKKDKTAVVSIDSSSFKISNRSVTSSGDPYLEKNVVKHLVDFFLERKEEWIAELQSNDAAEFVFSGYGEGGALSTLLAQEWKSSKKDLPPNAVKVVTFSVADIGTRDFVESLERELGAKNIIDFRTKFSRTKSYGIPLYILPSEQLQDELLRSLFSTVSSIVILKELWWFYNSLWNEKVNLSSFIGTETLLHMSLCAVSIWYLKKSSHKNYIPSDNTIKSTFNYAKDNYCGNSEMPLDKVGNPPFFSTRRGIFKFLNK